MFEGLVAKLLNKYLGKYIQNLDSQNLEVGILGGHAELTGLTLRPEALYELDLPIEVKAGYVGKISIEVDWFNVLSKPAQVTIEDVYALAGPVLDRTYDATREAALENAKKKKILEDLEKSPTEENEEEDQGWLESLAATFVNNLQISVERVHIRYEDKITNPEHPFACGVMLNRLAAETTDENWKPSQVDGDDTSVHKLVKLSGLSVYWNPYLPEQTLVRNKTGTTVWRNLLRNSIDAHRILDEEFDFIVKPISAHAKVLMNKGAGLTVPRLVLDFFMDDIEVLVSRQQFLNVLCLQESFKVMAVNQKYRKYHPGVPFKGHVKEWWHYAYTAVVESKIRPFSWERIKAHRRMYNLYKDLYKKKLKQPGDDDVARQLTEMEKKLDVANIIIARGQAKYEYSKESPGTLEKKKSGGWWDFLFGPDSDEEEEEDIVSRPETTSEWILDSLTEEEREELFDSIGYGGSSASPQTNPEYVAHKLSLNLRLSSFSLVNYSKEVLKLSVTQFITSLEHRPDAGAIKISTHTESFVVEGVSVEHDLIPLVTSDVASYAPSREKGKVFMAEFELNPIHLEADMSLALNVQPVEIVYDEHAVTEVVAFFQVPQMSQEDMVAMFQQGLVLLTKYSRAGLQYAIETRKHLHVSVNMRSPYMVIPEYGTLHRGGNVLIFDLGKLKIESKPQQKVDSLEDLTLSEVEARLYDKYNVTITDVKALLCDSGDDWHTAQTKPDSEYHIVPSVAVQLNLFNSVRPDYTQLPRFQLSMQIEKLHFSMSEDQSHILIKFYYAFPMPGKSSRLAKGVDTHHQEGWERETEVVMAAGRSASLDFVDGAPPPALVDVPDLPFTFSRARDMRELQREPSINELKKMKKSVLKNSALRGDKKLKNRVSMVSTESDVYYTASDHSDEDVEEWAKGLDVGAIDDHNAESNIVTALGRFTLGEIVIQVSKSADKIDTPYLMLRVNRVCAEASLMKYGVTLHASLGGIQLVDKIHKGLMGEYLEVLNSKRDAELISVSYRMVKPECPEFITVYKGIEQGVVLKMSTIQLVFDRAAVIFLNSFVQGLFQSISSNLGESRLRKSTSTILSGPANEPYQHPEPPGFMQRLSSQVDTDGAPYTTQFHAILEVEDIEMKLCDHETNYTDIHVTGFEGRVAVKKTRTLLQAKLNDLSVQDLTENTLHPNIVTIEDDSVFDVKFVKYNQEAMRKPSNQPSTAPTDGSLRLRIGRVQAVFLYKFVAEMTSFFEPFMNPEVTEQYRVAAQQAAYNTIQDAQEQGTKISLCIDIKSPTVLVPEHSGSTNVVVLQLGDLSLKNYFEDTDLGGGVLQKWDHLYLSLDSVQVMRGKLTMNGTPEPQHTIIEPISLKLDLKRALPPHLGEVHYQLEGHLHKVMVNLLQTDLKVLMTVLRENLTEQGHLPAKIEDSDFPEIDKTPGIGKHSSVDTTTPVIEVEEPLLSAPEVSELVRQMTFQFELDGVCVRLLTEVEAGNIETGSPLKQPYSPYQGLALFEVDQLQVSGTKTQETLEVEIRLQAIMMKDIREHSKLAVKYIVQSQLKAAGHYDEGLPVIDMVYKQNEDGQQQVDVHVETVRVNVCIPYLLQISHFFMDSLASPQDIHSLDVRDTVLSARNSLVVSRTVDSMRSAMAEPRQPPNEVDTTDQSWIISGEFKQPELVLFADPYEEHSRVLVLKASGKFNYYLVNGKEDLDAKLKQVQIISGRYSLAKQTSSMLMHPCNLEFTRHRETATAAVDMKLKLSDIFLNVSASDVRICLGIWNEIQEDQGRGVDSRDASPAASKQYYDLWNTKKVSREEWLKPEEPEVKPQYSAAMFEEKAPPKEIVKVEAPKIQLMFEVENVDYHVPRLCIQSGLQMELFDISTSLRARADLHVDIHYFNDKLSLWEPFLEQVMVTEDHYRPWQVTFKMVQAPGYPISCQPPTPTDLSHDELDSAVNYWLSNAARQKSSSSETESDEDTEMTVIKNKTDPDILKAASKPRHASERSYDSGGHHKSIQGESDSEGELIDTLSSGLESMISSGGSSEDLTDEDDLFDSPEKHVFLTAKGPVHLSSGDPGLDEVDAAATEDDKQEGPTCTYLVLDSMDQMLINVTPQSLDVITEVLQTFSVEEESIIKSIQDLPGFELFNQLGEETEITLSDELRFQKDRLHNVKLSTTSYKEDTKAENRLVDIDEDETDGLQPVVSALATSGHMAISAAGMPVDNTHLKSDKASEKREYMSVKIKGFNELTNVSHKRDISQLIPLYPPQNNINYILWYNVEATHGRKVVTLRSPLQVVNELNLGLELYCLTRSLHNLNGSVTDSTADNSFTLLKTLGPGETYDVPLKVAYHCKLFVAPADKSHEKSAVGLWWQELCIAKEKRKHFTCLPVKPDQAKPFHFKVVCEDGPASMKGAVSMAKSTPHYRMSICPPVVVHNLLPYSLNLSLQESSSVAIEKGESEPLFSSDLATSPKLRIQVPDYLGHDWKGMVELTNDNEEFKAITMEIEGSNADNKEDQQNKQLSLSIHTKYTHTMDLYIYSPYWIVNKSGLPVQVRGSRSEFTYETGDSTKPLLFRFKKYKRKKAKLRVHQSKWTKSFSLDTVASHGVVICSDKERKCKYHFMLQIEMSRLRLTKIVTILPYYLVVNSFDQPLRYMEENQQADLWHDLEPGQCVPFWPVTEAKKLFVKLRDSNVCSQHFRVTHSHSTVLRMDKGSALCVDVSGGTDSSVNVVFRPYDHGDAPVQILNLCEDVFIKLYQKNQSQVSLLSPSQSVLYTWDDPTSERTLMWNVYNRKNTSHPAEIAKDKSGSVSLDIQTIRKSAVNESNSGEETGIISSLLRRSKSKDVAPSHDSSTDDESDSEMTRISTGSLIKKTRTDKVQVYWVSYMDGLQRKLLFTQDQRIAKRAQKINDAEPAMLEVFLALSGISVSLMNAISEEVAYLTLTSSPAMWEVHAKSKSRLLNVDLASLLEDKWRKGEDQVQIEDFLQADFEKMEMQKPFLGSLKRIYNPALWAHLRQSQHHTYVHSKVHRLQLDNQLNDAYFPTVFYPSPVPSFIVKKSGPKPFIEMILMRRQVPEKDIDTIKYASLLMQEFNIRVDKGFILSVYDIFASRQEQIIEKEQLQQDLDMVQQTLKDLSVVQVNSQAPKIFFEYVHLSPLKLRVSFSLYGNIHRAKPQDSSFASDIIDFFLNSVGATFTEIKEVELRMAYFQREGVMLTLPQLQAEVQSHYVSQAVKQAYVLVLGLDVLGNPYGLITDFTKGLGDFFYEPFMGSIQQPDKFAENLSYGVHSMLGHTVGSIAGSVSLVTGSIGRTMALLSFDEDYQMRRTRYMQQHPKHLPESIYLAGKSFVMGVAMGVSGVVVSPVRGVKEEGVEGFFKGIGKGLLGLLTKPTGGAVDMVSMAFDGIRRTAEMGEDVVVRIRPPRFIHPVQGLRAYSYYQAVGLRITQTVSKGKYSDTDVYWAHAPLSMDDKADVLLITDRRILYLEKCKFWGDWDVEWDILLTDLMGVPGLDNNKLIIHIKKDEDSFSFFSSDTYEVESQDKGLLKWLQKKIEEVIIFINQ